MKYLPLLLLLAGCSSTPTKLPSISHCFPDPAEVEVVLNAVAAEQPELSEETKVLLKDLIAHSGRRSVSCLADAISRKNADVADTIRRFLNADQ